MSNAVITWTLPAIDPGKHKPIESVRVETHVEGISEWTEIAARTPDEAQDATYENIPSGTWFFRAVVVDQQGARSRNPPEASLDVPFDAPPDVTDFAVILE